MNHLSIFMNELFKQLLTIWQQLKPFQKMVAGGVFVLVVVCMLFVLMRSTSSNLVPLFSGKALSKVEMGEVRAYLDQFGIPFEEGGEKGILVPADHLERIRLELAAAGIPKQGQGKGFELFDTNTWIKGEKELQVLEMRALKGQLEKDLSGFDSIKSASVILDIPPQRTFNTGPKYPTKASVILTLMPGARLRASQLRAVTNHLAGAVRGLEPHMIAISDASGKLYKSIDPEGTETSLREAEALFEEKIEQRVVSLLTRLVGREHFFANVQATLDKETENILYLSIATVLDKNALEERSDTLFQEEIERQLNAIGSGYGFPVDVVVDLIPFEKKKKVWMEKKRGFSVSGLIATALFLIAACWAALFLVKKYRNKEEESEEGLFRVLGRVDLKHLARSIQGEEPSTIALMVSYLEPARAQQLIAALPPKVQEGVLFHLTELEQED